MTGHFAHKSARIGRLHDIGDAVKALPIPRVTTQASLATNCGFDQNVFDASCVLLGHREKTQNGIPPRSGVAVEDDALLRRSCTPTHAANVDSAVNGQRFYERALWRRGSSVGTDATVTWWRTTLGPCCFITAAVVMTEDALNRPHLARVPARQVGGKRATTATTRAFRTPQMSRRPPRTGCTATRTLAFCAFWTSTKTTHCRPSWGSAARPAKRSRD